MKHSPAVEAAFTAFAQIVDSDRRTPTEDRIKHAIAELIAPRHELVRERARQAALPIAARHGLTVAAIIGRSRSRHITAARDELCGELVASGWRHVDVARALGVTHQAVGLAVGRNTAKQTSKAEARGDVSQGPRSPLTAVRDARETPAKAVAQAGAISASPSNVSIDEGAGATATAGAGRSAGNAGAAPAPGEIRERRAAR